MSALSFSFSPEATAKVHDLLLCLAKFGETVCMEARGDMASIIIVLYQRDQSY